MLAALVVGTATGILSGFGVGGGSLLVLYLTLFTDTPQYTAGGVNLLYFIACAPFALCQHIRHRLVEGKAVFWCTLAGVPVSVGAAFLASVVDASLLRRAFGIFLLWVGTRELFCRGKGN